MKRVIPALFFIFLVFTVKIYAQCASFNTDHCSSDAPTIVGNSISCNPPLNDGGRRNFRVTNMIANATYRVSNCGAGFDTQMTIRNTGGAVVGYNDDNGPACAGSAASIDYTPAVNGDYRIQINRYNCQSSGFLETGNITVTLIAEPPLPPDVYGVNLNCPGDASLPLTSTINCQATLSIGNTINGNLNTSIDNVALQPQIFISSGDPCAFDATDTSNYTSVDFTVDTTGTYIFSMETPSPYFDAMGYLFETASGFVPGTCSAGYIAGDDDDGPDLDPEITANLTAGNTYTLVTTKYSFSSTTHNGPFTWNVTGPAGDIDWYTTESGGIPIGSGSSFNPVGVSSSPLTDTNTAGIYSFWGACPDNPTIRYRADYVIGKVWNGTIGNTDWETVTNWAPNDALPTALDCIVIPNTGGNDPMINSSTNAIGNTLSIQSGATLIQNSNSTLTITNEITVETGGTYDMLDSSSLIQINDVINVVNGTFNMQRTTNIRQNDYVYWSSPVTNFNIESISPGTTDGYKYQWLPYVNRPPGPPGPLDFGEWQSYDSGILDIGKGYIVKGPAVHPTTPSPFSTSFSGTPNNGIITKSIERSTYNGGNYFYQPNPGGDNLLITSDDDNWNLIGNPYPSAINAISFLTLPTNNNIDGAIYLWTHGTDIGIGNSDPFYEDYIYNYNVSDYLAYNSSGTSSPSGFNGNIGAGQGFFVLMNDSGSTLETVTFNNAMRSSTYDNDQFYRTENPQNTNSTSVSRIWLDYINPSGQTNTTLVAYVDGATYNEDRMFDAAITKGNGLNIYSLIGEKAFLIQGRQLPFNTTDIVPIGLNITESGIQTIAINTLQGLFHNSDQTIYIEDLLTSVIHNLKDNPYSFSSETGFINDRFVLRYTNNSLNTEDNQVLNGVSVFEDHDILNIRSQYQAIKSVKIYDILGRKLYSRANIDSNRLNIESIKPSELTLILKISLVNGQQKITKIIF